MGEFVILDIWAFAISVFTGLFAITNPIANVPVFLGLTEGAGRIEKHRINKKATFTAFMIILIFTLLGKFIFDFFGITIPAFKITGGLLIFYAGFRMLQSKKSNLKTLEQVDVDDCDYKTHDFTYHGNDIVPYFVHDKRTVVER